MARKRPPSKGDSKPPVTPVESSAAPMVDVISAAVRTAVEHALAGSTAGDLEAIRADLKRRAEDLSSLQQRLSTLDTDGARRVDLRGVRGDLTRLQEAHQGLQDRFEQAVVALAPDRVRSAVEAAVSPVREELGTLATSTRKLAGDMDARTSEERLEHMMERLAERVATSVAEARWDDRHDALRAEYEKRSGSLQSEYERLDDRLDQLKNFLEGEQPGGIDVLRQRVTELEGLLSQARSDGDDLRRERETLKDRLDEVSRELSGRRLGEGLSLEEIERRAADLAEREADIVDRQTLESQVQRLQREVRDARADAEAWKALDRKEQQLEVDSTRLAELETQTEALRRDTTRMTRQRDEAKRSQRQLAQDLDEARRELVELAAFKEAEQARTRQIQGLRDQVFDLGSSNEVLRADVHERDKEIVRLRAILDDKQRELVSQQALEAEVRDRVRSELEQVYADRHDGLRERLTARSEAEAERLAAEHVAEAASLRTRLAHVQPQADRADRAERERDLAVNALDIERERIDALKAELAKDAAMLRQESLAVRDQLVTEAKDTAERIRLEAEADAERISKMNDDAQALLDELENAIADRRGEVEGLAGRKGILQGELESLRAQVDGLRDKQVPEAERIGQLERPVFVDADLPRVGERPTETEWLGNVGRGLLEAGFVFHPRLVRAFHTALKIQDQAPLVVLAGISGTGKSELPRLYADIGGLPFLPIPVQPSWDSPHDLLGFFNYTDGRLKAEPFARLLRQFSGEGRLREGLGLVLLDEMNLARVEYYFAELLSRLENRRSVRGSDDPRARARASVQVDTGPGQDPIDLYLDERLLLVGTMNEDESTLTLSDKVLDRASVLTFPAPSGLVLKNQGTAVRSSTRLSWEAWASWVKPPEDGAESAQLNQVQEVMRGLGRPFGHRLFRAILAYLVNYPDVDGAQDPETRREHAWSDQVAMKILPRLRGLECEDRDVRAGLDQLVQHLPEELREAFAKARERDFFAWTGAAQMYAATDVQEAL